MCTTSCVSYLYYHHRNLCNKIFLKVQVIVPPQSQALGAAVSSAEAVQIAASLMVSGSRLWNFFIAIIELSIHDPKRSRKNNHSTI